MKIAKFFSGLFAIVGTVLMVGTIGLCLICLDRKTELVETPAGAVSCAEALQSAVCDGDYPAVSRLLYGQPEFGVDRKPSTEAGIMIWDAFTGSLTFSFQGDFYATDSGIARDAVIAAMDISSVTAALNRQAHSLLTARVEAATEMEQLYDENNNFREELVADVIQEAVVRALAENAQQISQTVTVKFVCRDGQWWAVADGALLKVLSGGLA